MLRQRNLLFSLVTIKSKYLRRFRSAERIFRRNEPLRAPDSLRIKNIEVECNMH